MEGESKKSVENNLKSLKLDLEKQIRELETRKKNISKIDSKNLSDLKNELKEKKEASIKFDSTKKITKITNKNIEKELSVSKKNIPTKAVKKSGFNKKIILPLVLIAISLLALVYVYKLRQDLKNEKILLKEKQKEEIDYNKDAIFKEVEDETPEEDLQDVGQFKDVPEETTKDTTP